MISFEVKTTESSISPVELEVFLDKDGLAILLRKLEALQAKHTEHVHMFSTSWGGHELEDQPTVLGSSAIQHVKIYLR